MSLPQLVNTPFTIKLGDVELQAKKASIKDFALLQEYSKKLEEEKDVNTSVKQMIYSIMLCIKKAYEGEEKEQITEEYLAELIPLSFLQSNGIKKVLETLGFMIPTE